MSRRPPSRYRTGDPDLDERLLDLLDAAGAEVDRDQLFEILVSGVGLASDGADRLDLKITSAALKEMRAAFRAFGPYQHVPKVTIFGSARTLPEDPLYAQARELARVLAERGWIIVTGAGPGIMAAGFEGAGREHSFGVSIRLPFETSANEFIAGDDKLISMKYFFTRKLMLVKESRAFVSLPGGFGTLDEAFELLTLQQTGKSVPAPIVLLDVPGGTYWHGWERFVREEVLSLGLVSPEDLDLVLITDDVTEACAEITGFYRNFHSLRWVGNRLVLRLEAEPTDEEVAGLNEAYGDLCTEGRIERRGPTGAETSDADEIDRPRLVLAMDIFRLGRLRHLIDAVNALPSAPDVARLPPP
ncbi:LOG family protein [soil metagenome]